MTLSLVIFIATGIILALIILVRSIELNVNKYLLPQKIRTIGDNIIQKTLLAVFRFVVRIKQLVYREVRFLPSRLFRLTHIVWSKIKSKIDKFYEKMHRPQKNKDN